MASGSVPARSASTWLFAWLPIHPLWVGAGLLALSLASLVVVAQLGGELTLLRGLDEPWWSERDVRLALLVALFVPLFPTAMRYHELATAHNLAAVARLSGVPPLGPRNRSESRKSERVFGGIAVAMFPAVLLIVDRAPTLYFQSFYWTATKAFTWALAVLLLWLVGVLGARARRDAAQFSRLAERLPAVDLLEPESLSPFARQAIRTSVPWLLMLAFVSLNALDAGFLWIVIGLGSLALANASASLFVPLRGLRLRIQAEKHEEITRVNRAIRGEPGALAGSLLESRAEPSLSDLLAYRAEIQDVSEWPIDASTWIRFALYLGIPLGSWVGGALVERFLESALR